MGEVFMNYIIFAYAILLTVSAFFGYRKKLGVSIWIMLMSLILCILSLSSLLYSVSYLKVLVALLLILLSIILFIDRKRSGKKIYYSHHVIRFIFHIILIYFMF